MRSIVSFDRLRAKGRALSLCGPQPQIRTLIELVGLDRLPSVAVEPLQAVGS